MDGNGFDIFSVSSFKFSSDMRFAYKRIFFAIFVFPNQAIFFSKAGESWSIGVRNADIHAKILMTSSRHIKWISVSVL